MHSLYAGITNETEKIFLKKKTIFFLAVIFLLTAGTGILLAYFQNKTGIFAVTSANFPIMILGILTNLFLPLFIFSIVGDVFAGEIGEKTIKLSLTRPISRFRIFLAKTLAVGIFTTITLAVLFLITILAGLFLDQGANLLPSILQIATAYLVAVIPMLTLIIIAAFIAQFCKSSSSALTAGILIYLAVKLLPFIPFVNAKVLRIIPFTYTDWHTLWLGNSLVPGNLLTIFLLLVAYGIIFFTGGYYLFDKKDF